MTDWATLVREQTPMLFQTAWRLLGHRQDTEDAVQDALLEAYRERDRSEVKNWGGFLRTAVTRRALDRLRRRRATTIVPEELASPVGDEPQTQVEARELAAWLQHAVAQLPARQAEVFSLRCFAEMSNAEIAAALNITTEAAAVALHKARESLSAMHNTRSGTSIRQ